MSRKQQLPPEYHPITKICIIGGGFGGLYTALYLQNTWGFKKQNCQITLIDQHDHLLFTPLLYEVITGELDVWEIAPSFEQLLKNTNIQFDRDKVQNVDFKTRQISLESRRNLTYDYLVMAMGCTNGKLPMGAENVLTFRTLADTKLLDQRLQALENSTQEKIRVTIVGGGPSGVELAGKIADRLGGRGKIRLIERGKEILKNFTPATRKNAQRALEKRKVLISLQTSVNSIEADQILIWQAGESAVIPTDLILWTAGTQTRDWVKNLDCSHNSKGQVISQPTLQLVDYPEVFVLGDMAEVIDASSKQVPATAQVAYQQAGRAAKNIWSCINKKRLRPFRYLHLGEMITLGVNVAAISSFGISLSGSLAALVRLVVYIQRLPTLSHKIKVIRHRLKIWLRNLLGK